VVRDSRVAMSDSLPVIELASSSDTGARRALGISISEDVAVDVAHSEPRPSESRTEPYIGQDDSISAVRVLEEQEAPRGPQIVLDWPSESERRIVTLRVIPRVEARFQGRGVRQAFSAAGFWHGPLDIYHLPDDDGRVVVSAAALAQPGTFDPSIMDSQRFSGLNLFAVLPGPKPERETFDELVHAARQTYEAGYRRINGYSPYPIEELWEAIGFTHTRLPLIVFIGGLLGGIGGFLMQFYIAVWDYPLNVGGKPYNSWPAFIPITFECTILVAAFSAVLGMLVLNKLPQPYHPVFNLPNFALATRDRFFLAIEANDAKFNHAEVVELLKSLDAIEVNDVEV